MKIVSFWLLQFIIRHTVLLSIQPKALTSQPMYFHEVFRKSFHPMNTNKGSIVKQSGTDVGSFHCASNYQNECKACPPEMIRLFKDEQDSGTMLNSCNCVRCKITLSVAKYNCIPINV